MSFNVEEAKVILENAKKSQEQYFNAIIRLIERIESKGEQK